MFVFCPTIVSQQVVEHHATVADSAKASSFEQRLDRRVRFDTASRTLVASIVELAFTYQLPTGIEYADHEATTRPLNLHFQNESVRRILEAITEQVPGYSVSFSGGIVDVFAAKGREDPSNVLNKVIKDFAVDQVDTHEADSQLFCELAGRNCLESIALGQWGPLKITLHLQNAKVYEVLNAIVAENGKAIWTVIVRPDELSKPQGSIWYIYPLEQPFKADVSERLEHPKLAVERQLTHAVATGFLRIPAFLGIEKASLFVCRKQSFDAHFVYLAAVPSIDVSDGGRGAVVSVRALLRYLLCRRFQSWFHRASHGSLPHPTSRLPRSPWRWRPDGSVFSLPIG